MARVRLELVNKPANSKGVLDSSVFFKLIRVVNLVSRPFNEGIGKQHKLSLNEWRVLVVLASHQACAATDVVYYSGLDKMSVSRALAGLTRAQRIRRVTDSQDARRAQIFLTDKGRNVFERVSESAQVRERNLLSSLSEPELARFDRTLEKLALKLTQG